MKVLELRQSRRYDNLERLIVQTAAYLRPLGIQADILVFNNRNRARLLGEDEAQWPLVHPMLADAQVLGLRASQEMDLNMLSPNLLALARSVRAGGYDVLHTHDVKTDLYGLAIGALTGVPVVATAHGYPRAIRRNGVYRRIDLWLLRCCRLVICVSEGLRRELLAAGLPASNLTVVHNGLAAAEVARQAQAGQFDLRRDLGLPDDALIVMAVGRCSAEKGHCVLLAAMAVACRRRANLHLVLVGDGPLRQELEEQAHALGIGGSVTFLGYRRDVPALLAQCDIVANPSLSEALGSAVLEAMSLARPVIGTLAGGLPEAIVDGETGLLVPAGDAQALAAAVLRLADDPDLRRQLGARAAGRVRSVFTVENMASGLASAYAAATAGAMQGGGVSAHATE